MTADKSQLTIAIRVDSYEFCEGISNDELEIIVPPTDVASGAAE